MKRTVLAAVLVMVVAGVGMGAEPVAVGEKGFHKWAEKPVMGWNSWDCFGTAVTEEQALANATYMEEKLKKHGWEYLTVDIQWYEPQARGLNYRRNAVLEMDEYGRLLPAPNRFPMTEETRSFKPLADAVHAKGLKFGLHLMRGIPRQAVRQNTPILGTIFKAADIANANDTCPWNPDMYGVDMTKPGAQEYYDSVFALMASWDLDLVKVDDLSARIYHEAEVAAIRKAIDKSGRKIVFSTSPGATPLASGGHVSVNANQWRISDDFWDSWGAMKEQFKRLDDWTAYRGPGYFPDADMLPLGNVRAFEQNGWTRFTKDEQYTLMNLWSIARSPLILGGNLPKNDEFTLSLLTNDELIAVDQNSTGNRQVSRKDDLVVWVAQVSEKPKERYVGLFNAQEIPAFDVKKAAFASGVVNKEKQTVEISVDLKGARNLWLAVEDAGDGHEFDHADWVSPKLVGKDGEKALTEITWRSATAGFERARLNRTVGNRVMTVGGKTVEGIGTHANSLIRYELPEGVEKFTAVGAIDDTGKAGVGPSTVRFYVFLEDPKPAEVKEGRVSVMLKELGLGETGVARDVWTKKEWAVKGEVGVELRPHASAILKVTGE